MDDILDRYLDETLLTEQEKAKVQQIVNNYKRVDMDLFVQRIGGPGKIEEMKRINDISDRMYVVDGVVRKRPDNSRENLEEWKKGFMEGFEEAYKRFNLK
jgi:hypothetical protein